MKPESEPFKILCDMLVCTFKLNSFVGVVAAQSLSEDDRDRLYREADKKMQSLCTDEITFDDEIGSVRTSSKLN